MGMTGILTPETLALFLYFVVPGIVVVKVYDLIVPTTRRDASAAFLDALACSFMILAVGLEPQLSSNCRQKRRSRCTGFPGTSRFYLQIHIFLGWAMLVSNQRPLPCEVCRAGSNTPCSIEKFSILTPIPPSTWSMFFCRFLAFSTPVAAWLQHTVGSGSMTTAEWDISVERTRSLGPPTAWLETDTMILPGRKAVAMANIPSMRNLR